MARSKNAIQRAFSKVLGTEVFFCIVVSLVATARERTTNKSKIVVIWCQSCVEGGKHNEGLLDLAYTSYAGSKHTDPKSPLW